MAGLYRTHPLSAVCGGKLTLCISLTRRSLPFLSGSTTVEKIACISRFFFFNMLWLKEMSPILTFREVAGKTGGMASCRPKYADFG